MILKSIGVLVSCPECGTLYPLTSNLDMIEIERPYFECKCGNNYSYIECKEDYALSSNIFLEYNFVSTSIQLGDAEINVGELTNVRLKPPLEIRKVFLTPYKHPLFLHPIYGSGMTDSFEIISSRNRHHDTPDKVKVGWLVYGDTKELKIPFWLETLQNAKEYQIKNDFPMAIVSCWSGFETFLDTTIREKLEVKTKLKKETIDWLLDTHPRHKLRKWLCMEFKEIKKEDATKYWEKIEPLWNLRSKIVHGEKVEINRGNVEKAFKNIFEVIKELYS